MKQSLGPGYFDDTDDDEPDTASASSMLTTTTMQDFHQMVTRRADDVREEDRDELAFLDRGSRGCERSAAGEAEPRGGRTSRGRGCPGHNWLDRHGASQDGSHPLLQAGPWANRAAIST